MASTSPSSSNHIPTSPPSPSSPRTPVVSKPKAGTVRLLSVCGSPRFNADHWQFADFVLWHDVLTNITDKTNSLFMICVDISKPSRSSAMNLNGHTQCERVVLNEGFGHFRWATTVPKEKLKDEFLATIKRMAGENGDNDRLVIVIAGHGAESGAVALGEYRHLLRPAHPALLHPVEVFDLLRPGETKGEATIVVNSCHSGRWIQEAYAAGLGSEQRNMGVTLVVRSVPEGPIHTFDASTSFHFWGGHLTNVLADRLLRAFCQRFPAKMRVGASEPSTLDGCNLDPLTTVGIVPPLRCRLFRVVPANPSAQFESQTGSCPRTSQHPKDVKTPSSLADFNGSVFSI